MFRSAESARPVAALGRAASDAASARVDRLSRTFDGATGSDHCSPVSLSAAIDCIRLATESEKMKPQRCASGVLPSHNRVMLPDAVRFARDLFRCILSSTSHAHQRDAGLYAQARTRVSLSSSALVKRGLATASPPAKIDQMAICDQDAAKLKVRQAELELLVSRTKAWLEAEEARSVPDQDRELISSLATKLLHLREDQALISKQAKHDREIRSILHERQLWEGELEAASTGKNSSASRASVTLLNLISCDCLE